MRAIEFRAWLKDRRMMVDVEGLDFEHKYIEYKENDDDKYVSYAGFDEIELMQWTGQRDKTRTEQYPIGKKIFEGDIVKYRNRVYQVVFDEETCRFTLLNNEGYEDILANWLKCYYVVLGNIYENPELLEVK